MSNISPALVKELREKTGAGMMDCKKALSESKGDLETAIDWLRKKGLSAAAKKAGRVAAEGLIGVACKGTQGAMVEVNAETDFVGRNEQFQKFVHKLAEIAETVDGNLKALKAASYGDGKSVEEQLTHLVSTIGENMNIRRSAYMKVSEGVVSPYIHNVIAPNLGRIGVLVALESKGDKKKLEPLAKQIAMHVAAAHPTALTIAEVDPAELERERQILRDQALESGKPEEFVDKMVEGRLRKYYEEVVLEEQAFVMDGKTKIKDVVANAAKEAAVTIKLVGFARFALGEGIEKEEKDFASEVASQLKK